MQYLEYIKIILTSNLLSGFIGSIVGGFVTWLVIKNSFNKQFEYQNKLVKSEQIKQEKVALKSVRSEIVYNLIYLRNYKRVTENDSTDTVTLLKVNKWEKHSDTIENIDNLEYIGELQEFYLTISVEITFQMIISERTDRLFKSALKLSELLENTYKTYE